MKYFLSSLILLSLFTSFEVFADSKVEWSEYQGELNWNSAMDRCKSIGFRLPTRNEIISAYNEGITKSWENNRRSYWTSEAFSPKIAYTLVASNGKISYGSKDTEVYVRCIR